MACADCAKQYEPAAIPKWWFFIDAVCAVFSVLLLVLNNTSNAKGVLLARGCYLTYNFITCIIWCIEVGRFRYAIMPS